MSERGKLLNYETKQDWVRKKTKLQDDLQKFLDLSLRNLILIDLMTGC